MRIYNDITEVVGRTPLVRLNNVVKGIKAKFIAKLEGLNPLSSVKDRVGLAMIKDAEERGILKSGSVIIEPTSGNTGIALAFVAAARGYKLILVMPDSMSRERRAILEALGAELVLTQGDKGMKGALDKACRLSKEIGNSFMPNQFSNPVNPQIHRKTTAEEIWGDTEGKLDAFICGVGTGGTITGVGEILKERKKEIRIIAVEPKESPVMSGGKPGMHKIQGIGAGFIPDVLNRDIIDEVIQVSSKDAIAMTNRLAREEGIFAGVSSGAAIYAALKVGVRKEFDSKLVLTLFPDAGDRYISMDIFQQR